MSCRHRQAYPKLYVERHRPRGRLTIWNKKQRVGGMTLPAAETDNIAVVIKTVWHSRGAHTWLNRAQYTTQKQSHTNVPSLLLTGG